MRKVFLLVGTVYNGTVTLATTYSVFTSAEVAKKAKEKLEDTNGNNDVVYRIKEAEMYETEQDVPVLNITDED